MNNVYSAKQKRQRQADTMMAHQQKTLLMSTPLCIPCEPTTRQTHVKQNTFAVNTVLSNIHVVSHSITSGVIQSTTQIQIFIRCGTSRFYHMCTSAAIQSNAFALPCPLQLFASCRHFASLENFLDLSTVSVRCCAGACLIISFGTRNMLVYCQRETSVCFDRFDDGCFSG